MSQEQDEKDAQDQKDIQSLMMKLRITQIMDGRDHQDDPIIIGKPPDTGTTVDDDIQTMPPDIQASIRAKDNPLRQESPTGGLKDNRGKPPVDLLPSQALFAIAEVLGYGADKYHPHNWRMGISWSQTYGSLMRHLFAWNDGEEIDEESGLHHLALAGGQLLFLLEYHLTDTGQDDRFSTVSKTTTEGYRDQEHTREETDG